MSGIIDRMLEAWLAACNSENKITPPFAELDADQLEFGRKGMRAILAAIREPTEAMLKACADFDIVWEYKLDDRPGSPEDVWRAMVDEARK